MDRMLDNGALNAHRYMIRARRARRAGRMLIPVLMLTMSAAAWSDPAISAEVKRGLATIKPMLAGQTVTERAQKAIAKLASG